MSLKKVTVELKTLVQLFTVDVVRDYAPPGRLTPERYRHLSAHPRWAGVSLAPGTWQCNVEGTGVHPGGSNRIVRQHLFSCTHAAHGDAAFSVVFTRTPVTCR